ncbi:SAM-dependent methyltransferase [Chitinophaga sp. Mgbs1]|uniref:S-adenosyl-L-methionine-dependent methyltransferase n=1 Tax=Chitinophaga solisilvae TaxID=1233460 RepID=A0A433WLQ7_9BACT|nr:SAM-dependent methyltransferase [Chitinophaga solisilvae]
MKATATSKTAQYMALFRALETTRPKEKRLFTDNYAHLFLSGSLKIWAWLCRLSPVRTLAERIIRKKIPGAYTSGIARTRYIDDLLNDAVQHGVEQVMILGAGFDTRGFRLPSLGNVPVIEIDHPNTARFKLTKLRNKKIPSRIRFYQIDFNKQSLDQLSAMHHFDFSRPTAVIWEGVTNYLSPEAIDNTFAFIRRFKSGSCIIFTYIDKKVLETPAAYTGGEKLLQDVSALEEKWTFGFRPEELKDYLLSFDLELLEDMGAAAYRQRYMPDRSEEGYEFYRVAYARKK